MSTFKTISDEQSCNAQLAAIGDALYAIGGKWKLRIIVALIHGKGRFNYLQRTIPGISAKVLASELKDLEQNGFVKRTAQGETSVVIEYELTAYAESLHEVLDTLSAWGTKHRKKIRQAMKESFEAARS